MSQESELSLENLLEQAEADPAAAHQLGLRYHAGQGVLQNYTTAAAWFEKAASQGFAPAQNMLARYLFEGFGGDADRARALTLFRKAAQSGTPQFLFDLAKVLETDPETAPRAAELYQQASDAGMIDAQVSLGVLYQEGIGVKKDLAIARRLYEPAAEAGHARAQNNLGLLYVRGEGVAQDYERAAALFQAAAEQRLARAMTNLGVLYENGFGVPVDEERAAELYRMGGNQRAVSEGQNAAGPRIAYDARLQPPDLTEEGLETLKKAAAAGDPVALFQMGWLQTGANDTISGDMRAAARLFRAAAERGHPTAMRNLAVLYLDGLGVPQDYVLGHMWLLLAEKGGDPGSVALRVEIAEVMTSGQINEAQRRAADKPKD
ncbi:SEL1-like repeat protein [Sulfitobacter aestuariivivens]|uniref:SEL1-like repeat protein n=1 Tax=Sulfitobacter aestuariivivens TaxID=2766981 RepID=UPI0036137CE0